MKRVSPSPTFLSWWDSFHSAHPTFTTCVALIRSVLDERHLHHRKLSSCRTTARLNSITASPAICRSSTTTATCRRGRLPRTTASPTSRRSGSMAIITSGGRCDRPAWRNAIAPATPRTGRNSRSGPRWCPRRSAIRSITGPTWNSSGPSGSATACSIPRPRGESGSSATRCSPATTCRAAASCGR